MLVWNSSFLHRSPHPCPQHPLFLVILSFSLKCVRLFLFGKEAHFCPFLDLTGSDILWPLSLPVSLSPLGGTISAFSPVARRGMIPSPLRLSSIAPCVPHCRYPSSSPSMLRWFCVLATVPSAAVITGLPLCLKWFCPGLCPGLGPLGSKVLLCLAFWRASILFSLVDVLMCILNNGAGGLPSLHTLSSVYCWRCLEMAIVTHVRWYLIELLICLSPIISDTEHLSMCLMAICMTPSQKCPFLILGTYFSWVVCIFDIELHKLTVFFVDEFLMGVFVFCLRFPLLFK